MAANLCPLATGHWHFIYPPRRHKGHDVRRHSWFRAERSSLAHLGGFAVNHPFRFHREVAKSAKVTKADSDHENTKTRNTKTRKLREQFTKSLFNTKGTGRRVITDRNLRPRMDGNEREWMATGTGHRHYIYPPRRHIRPRRTRTFLVQSETILPSHCWRLCGKSPGFVFTAKSRRALRLRKQILITKARNTKNEMEGSREVGSEARDCFAGLRPIVAGTLRVPSPLYAHCSKTGPSARPGLYHRQQSVLSVRSGSLS